MTSSIRADSVSSSVLPTRFQQSTGVVGTRQGDTTVLLDVNGGMYYTLNEVGGRIWELIGVGEATVVIVERLWAEYEVPLEQVVGDTAAMIDRLLAAKLIQPAR